MIKMPVEDFILEIKGEIMCYDQLDETLACEWENEFRKVYKKSRFIKEKQGKAMAVLKDESEL